MPNLKLNTVIQNNSLLKSHDLDDIMTLSGITELYEYMQKETKLKEVCNLDRIKERHDDGRNYIYINRKQFIGSNRKDLINKLYDNFFGFNNCSFEEMYEDWLLWRRNIGTDAKTIKENANDWKHFLANNELSKMPMKDIELSHLENFFYEITKGHAITYKRLSNVRSLLNGIFKRALSLKIITHNPVFDVDYTQFKKRCKPQNTKKDNYTTDECLAILGYLEMQDDIYSLAIQFSFYLCIRIGELVAIKWEDIKNNVVYINRSTRKNQALQDDMTFGSMEFCTEERLKGNQEEGFRFIPLTDKAINIAERARAENPNGEYLFMRNDRQLLGDTFNEKLKRVCNILGIKYRSSHQIRFTVATMLHENDFTINEISNFLGHSDTKTTWHYIRQKKPTDKTADKMRAILG